MAPEIISAIQNIPPSTTTGNYARVKNQDENLAASRNLQKARSELQETTQRTREARAEEEQARKELLAAESEEKRAREKVSEAQSERQQSRQTSPPNGKIINVLV